MIRLFIYVWKLTAPSKNYQCSLLISLLRHFGLSVLLANRCDPFKLEKMSFLESGLWPIRVGYPAHFGPHVLLPETEFRLVWRLLRCNRCRFRKLYHKLVRDDRLRAGCVANVVQPFHSLTMAIKAVLLGLSLNRRLSPQLIVESSNCTSGDYSSPAHSFTAVIRTTVKVQNLPSVCPSHARDLFALFYCDETENRTAIDPSASFSRFIVPEGHSSFFRLHFADEDTTDEDETNVATEPSAVSVVSLSTHVFSGPVQNFFCNIQKDSWREANEKWNSFYDVRVHKRSTMQTVSKHPDQKPAVRFPLGSPVSAVHCMFTYAVASKLERKNRKWEIEAHHRVFDRYRRLLCEGVDPITASERAAICDETEELAELAEATSEKDEHQTVCTIESTAKRRLSRKQRKHRKFTSSRNKHPSTTERMTSPKQCYVQPPTNNETKLLESKFFV
ncbi:hypothetical protein P879_00867 [Paragonimus westermani]|uniref:Uncharacterized protein n=1 Tax=Paragonimus westermani TaxID=34504 RepID=A0A8T0DPS2_9TREM|nr:hypothetical protein P879_00867 [Paragonimus westermani]